MNRAQLFPLAMMILQTASAVVYSARGDWRRALYWFAAVAITAAVTF